MLRKHCEWGHVGNDIFWLGWKLQAPGSKGRCNVLEKKDCDRSAVEVRESVVKVKMGRVEGYGCCKYM